MASGLRTPVSSAAKVAEALYEPLRFVMVRAPLLPVKLYQELSTHRSWALVNSPRVRQALVVGSPSLLGAVERFEQSALSARDTDRMRSRVLRYLIRMTTRPTPFGLFAGVAIAEVGNVTDIFIHSTCAGTRTRPDMAWLMDVALSAEKRLVVRRHLKFRTNQLTVLHGGRVSLPHRAPVQSGEIGPPVSIRATNAVLKALDLARSGILYQDLAAHLMTSITSATPEKVDRLLTELWEQTFLLSELRPPVTADSPAEYIANRLASIPEASEEFGKLRNLLQAAAEYDQTPAEESVQAFRSILRVADQPSDGSKESPVQTDMKMSITGRIGAIVADEAARAAELLLRLTPAPRGSSSLAAYRQAFIGRYGPDREVGLLELIDSQRGLGPLSAHGHASVGPEPAKAALRAQTLLSLACTALRFHSRAVELDETLLERLETCKPDVLSAPLSLDINVQICASSPAAVDAGMFSLVIGPNLGALAAGRNLGRFASLTGAPGERALQQIAETEAANLSGILCAEMVYLPPKFRSANVVIRPVVRTYEVPLGVSPGVEDRFVIPIGQLVVGIENNRFYVRWPQTGKRVAVFSGHMLNPQSAPVAGRFLVELSNDGKAIFNSFDWGPAETFPFLPRVQSGRVILRPAQWRIHKGDLSVDSSTSFRQEIDRYRDEWDLPRHVSLSIGDNRLVLDLEDDAQAQELRTELVKLPERGWLILQEVVPSLEEAWLSGSDGNYFSELVISLLRRPQNHAEAQFGGTSPTPVEASAIDVGSGPRNLRVHAPGSEWLFLKLYCSRDLESDIVCGPLRNFSETVVSTGLADLWFFIRYADPEPHLRVRFHGDPERLTDVLFGQLCAWAGGLIEDGICFKYAFDTYDQEVERFGGDAGIGVAESVFAADSKAVVQILETVARTRCTFDQTTLLALTVDDLLVGLGYSQADRKRWYQIQTTGGGQEVGNEYRQRKKMLRSLLGDGSWLPTQSGGPELMEILAGRREALAVAGEEFRRLESVGALSRSLDVLCSSFVHLHINRMGGMDTRLEQNLLSLLLRTTEGLNKAPVAGPR